MIRSIYIAEKASFTPINIGGLVGGLKQYGSNDLNGFRPQVTTDASDIYHDMSRIFPFLNEGKNKEINKIKKDLLHAYKLRSYFQPPFKNYIMLLQSTYLHLYGGCDKFVTKSATLITIMHNDDGVNRWFNS